MKNLLVFTTVLFLFLNTTNNIFPQGKISEVEDGDLFNITVKGYAFEDLWLGCTINPDSPYEVDLKPEEVPKGNFTIKFNLVNGVVSSLMNRNSSIQFAVALWQEKINLRECEKKYGEGSERCKWARANKYQMEGRVDRYLGYYSP